jgi:hypothetical protein
VNNELEAMRKAAVLAKFEVQLLYGGIEENHEKLRSFPLAAESRWLLRICYAVEHIRSWTLILKHCLW